MTCKVVKTATVLEDNCDVMVMIYLNCSSYINNYMSINPAKVSDIKIAWSGLLGQPYGTGPDSFSLFYFPSVICSKSAVLVLKFLLPVE